MNIEQERIDPATVKVGDTVGVISIKANKQRWYFLGKCIEHQPEEKLLGLKILHLYNAAPESAINELEMYWTHYNNEVWRDNDPEDMRVCVRAPALMQMLYQDKGG